MTPEDQIRFLAAEQKWRLIHGDRVPVPWDSKTGYDASGLSGLSEDEMRRRTTTPASGILGGPVRSRRELRK